MAKFLDTFGVSASISDLLKDSKGIVYILSPFLKFCDKFKEDLVERNYMKYETRIIYGKADLQPDVSDLLATLKYVRVMYCQNLHAKCYCSESAAIITSMNMYDFSQINNEEMGLLVTSSEEPETFDRIFNQVNKIMRKSDDVELSVKKIVPKEKKTESSFSSSGFCIRCGTEIPLDLSHPYCEKCFSSWSRYEDPEYVEKKGVCHFCGKSNKSSMNKPNCKDCFRELQKSQKDSD